MDDGIIVGADQTQEWIFPWWWHHYSQHNKYPVTFVDFGLTAPMKAWCKKRGNYIHLKTHIFAAEKENIEPTVIKQWEKQFGPRVWTARMAWFKKPLACLQSPYERSLWIDVDCEVRTDLSPLFEYCKFGLALAKDQIVPAYNSGVIAFKKIDLLREWAEKCETNNEHFSGDQEVLTHIIKDKKIGLIPNEWNWSRCSGPNPKAHILHWHGDNGRLEIRQQMERLCL